MATYAKHGDGTARPNGLGMIECKGIDGNSGDLGKAEERLRIKERRQSVQSRGPRRDRRVDRRDHRRRRQSAAMVELTARPISSPAIRILPTLRASWRNSWCDGNRPTSPALTAMPLGGTTVESARQACPEAGREHSIRRWFGDVSGALAQYMHGGDASGYGCLHGRRRANRQVILRACRRVRRAGRGAPVCVSREQVPKELIEKERAIFSAQAPNRAKLPKSSPRWSKAGSTSFWPK